MRKYIIAFLALAILSLLPELGLAQCAMCKAVAESSSGSTAAKGLNNGILFLMFIPYLMMGVVAVSWYFYKRKGQV
ncbi:MAG: hypothetical protein EA358_07685 [Flavobacteriales bacterium]|nr:MAG: hypothetical protein EA358_07685 [Flavobacteriales bacterium]